MNLDQGYQDIDQIIVPREEINLYIKNSNNPYSRNYFSERIRIFEKIFPSGEKILQYRAQENFVNNLREEKEKKNYSKKQKINYWRNWRKVKFSPKPTYCTTSPVC